MVTDLSRLLLRIFIVFSDQRTLTIIVRILLVALLCLHAVIPAAITLPVRCAQCKYINIVNKYWTELNIAGRSFRVGYN